MRLSPVPLHLRLGSRQPLTSLRIRASAVNIGTGKVSDIAKGVTDHQRTAISLIEQQFTEVLRVAVSIKTSSVTASLILRKRGTYNPDRSLARALRELRL